MCADDLYRYGRHGEGAVFDSGRHTGAACGNHNVAVALSKFDRGPQGILKGVHDDAGEHLGFNSIDDQDVHQIDQLRSERTGRRSIKADDNAGRVRLSGGRQVDLLAGFVLQQETRASRQRPAASMDNSGIIRLEPETITAP